MTGLHRYPGATKTAEGTDHTAYTSDDILIRVAKRPDPAATTREAAVLRTVAEAFARNDIGIHVPVPIDVDPDAGLLAYRLLPGTPLLHAQHSPHIATGLGRMLAVLHAIPTDDLPPTAPAPSADWLTACAEDFPAAARALSADQRRAVESFLAEPPPPDTGKPVLVHGDLGAEHLLTVDGAVVGVIDWADAEVGERARDFARLFRDLAPAAYATVLAEYTGGWDPRDEALTRFHARCALVEDIAHGLTEDEPAYLRAALANFAHTFAGG